MRSSVSGRPASWRESVGPGEQRRGETQHLLVRRADIEEVPLGIQDCHEIGGALEQCMVHLEAERIRCADHSPFQLAVHQGPGDLVHLLWQVGFLLAILFLVLSIMAMVLYNGTPHGGPTAVCGPITFFGHTMTVGADCRYVSVGELLVAFSFFFLAVISALTALPGRRPPQ